MNKTLILLTWYYILSTSLIINATYCFRFILAISWMEAWVKFKAPLLPKYIALDVGRHVFKALNIVEVIFLMFLWVLPICGGSANHLLIAIQSLPLFKWLTIMVLFEVFVITPFLIDRAKYIILNTIDGDKEHKMLVSQLRDEVSWKGKESFKDAPSIRWHFIYILLEFIKICLLAYLGYIIA